ncbi:MAG: helix-turn-helix domain-containing protein [Pirellulales bacterium]|nr:helix-turn-helix domain-containing protein [Pirellulales bacterium]
MAKTFKSWLKKQLAKLDEIEQWDEIPLNVFDDLRNVIHEAERKAAAAGVPNAVAACRKLRPGGISIGIAREVLAECLQAISVSPDPETPDGPLTVQQAARLLNISTRKVYSLCESGELSHTTNPIRIQRRDLDAYQKANVKASRLRLVR